MIYIFYIRLPENSTSWIPYTESWGRNLQYLQQRWLETIPVLSDTSLSCEVTIASLMLLYHNITTFKGSFHYSPVIKIRFNFLKYTKNLRGGFLSCSLLLNNFNKPLFETSKNLATTWDLKYILSWLVHCFPNYIHWRCCIDAWRKRLIKQFKF